jgi:hypothetical protein
MPYDGYSRDSRAGWLNELGSCRRPGWLNELGSCRGPGWLNELGSWRAWGIVVYFINVCLSLMFYHFVIELYSMSCIAYE